jgi:hypothetical protein
MRFKLLCLSIASLALGACVTENVKLDRRHVDALSKRAIVGGLMCSLPVFELADVRAYKGLGWISGHELLYPELELWLGETLRNTATPDANASPLRIEIARAYIESHPSGHSFQLVLRARGRDDATQPWRVYRGSESGVTWWGDSDEFGAYVEDSGKRAIAALIKAEGACANG